MRIREGEGEREKEKRESREKGNGEKGKITCSVHYTSNLLIKITNLEVAQFNFFGYKI